MRTVEKSSVFLILFTFFSLSCKKDIDKKLFGNYVGTVNYRLYRHPDVVNPIKDTLFTDVIITISESESSTRKDTKLNMSVNTNKIGATPEENIPVIDGNVNYYTTERGTSVSNQWSGSITTDSLNLSYRRDDHQVYVSEYYFKAKKQ